MLDRSRCENSSLGALERVGCECICPVARRVTATYANKICKMLVPLFCSRFRFSIDVPSIRQIGSKIFGFELFVPVSWCQMKKMQREISIML